MLIDFDNAVQQAGGIQKYLYLAAKSNRYCCTVKYANSNKTNLCLNQIQTSALNAAIELNLFEIIARAHGGRHVSASEVASQLPNLVQHQDLAFRLDRLLRLLVHSSLLTCSYVANQGGDTQGERERDSMGFLLWANSLVNFKDAITDKDTDLFKKVHGISFFHYAQKDPTLINLFNKSMSNLSFIFMKRILEVYKGFEGISTLVDVGGGNSQTLKMILSKYPSIKGINFDLPHVIQKAPSHPGIEHIGGDMFVSVPKGDAIILKNVCHNWSDENCIKIMRKCYEALAENGKLIVVEFIMPEVDTMASEEGKYLCSLDNLMFLFDGRERSEKEMESLCKTSGFSAFKIASRAFSILGVMEFYK
ncbi:isoliquiritigenin 2'-O-methyltransferase-like [Senna tora]|uniref:Isoliquiritigenin 2'-O-methyltransferase-like n=1 Tax=Senna tora TaxID=362788 RepID=A0A834X1X8_9FABA|nr:isoliquiritigenin 2'-O-methyltransferase-like [Senna tora]